ncbi:MAG: TetR/AcrR family transcriptional regulator, partial [Proteobacteria bacterium]|nr:TetR/AcrR family transcriptional regulator [Pseudomonadota bacterium]
IEKRKQIEKDALRLKILQASSKIIIRDGFKNFSIRKLAKEIDYSPTTIYLYFKNKSDLIEQLGEEGEKEYSKRKKKISTKIKNSPVLYLKEIIKIIINLAIENPDIYLVRNSGEEAQRKTKELNNKSFDKKLSSKYRDIYSTIKTCVKEELFKKLNTEVMSISVISSIQGLISMIILSEKLTIKRREEIIQTTLEILIDGLKK